MEKKYVITSLLTLVFAALLSASSFAQVRITQVVPSTETVTIHNYGGSTVNISSFQLCTLFNYDLLSNMTLVNGSLNLTSGADVTITSSVLLRDLDADLGLYNSSSFTSPTAMQDFLQWGDAGNGRESVAVSKGIWTAGEFISAPAPYAYTGNGTSENGKSFWGTVLGIDDFETPLLASTLDYTVPFAGSWESREDMVNGIGNVAIACCSFY